MAASWEQIANDAMTVLLAEADSSWAAPRGLNTKSVVNRIRTKWPEVHATTDHLTIRNVLNRLYARGSVSRAGDGKFYWKIINKNWNRDYPFANYGSPKSFPTKDDEVEDEYTSVKPKPNGEAKNLQYEKLLVDALQRITGLEKQTDAFKGLIKTLVDTDTLMRTRLNALEEQKSAMVKVLEIKKYDGNVVKLKNLVLPKVFEHTLALAKQRRNIMLFGPAGCGKSYLAELIAKTLDMEFGTLSCTSGMSESHLLGRAVPDLTHGKNRFQTTPFLERYEKGGVMLLDEFDAADSNLLLCINQALTNGYCAVPNRTSEPVAKKHDDFVCIATANTIGRGATRMYYGRNQLDESTLDRFRIGVVECEYDPQVEMAVCPDGVLRARLQTIRTKIENTGLRRIMSTRFMQDAYVMMKTENWSIDKILDVFFSGWTEEEKVKVR